MFVLLLADGDDVSDDECGDVFCGVVDDASLFYFIKVYYFRRVFISVYLRIVYNMSKLIH